MEKIQVGDFQQGLEIETVKKGVETQIVFVGGELWVPSEDFEDFKEDIKKLMEKYFI